MSEMSDRGQQCPFLNRADSRCGSHFTLERLEHAFAFCFDQYNACPVYQELLAERLARRAEAREMGLNEPSHGQRPLVELTIRAGANGQSQSQPHQEKSPQHLSPRLPANARRAA